MLREGIHDRSRCTRLNITRKLPDSAKVLTARSAMSCPSFKSLWNTWTQWSLFKEFYHSLWQHWGWYEQYMTLGEPCGRSSRQTSCKTCHLPWKQFCSLHHDRHCLYTFFLFFGLKSHISKIMLLEWRGLSENFISIVMLISYTHSATHWKCYFQRS